jgi:hypothetical protein
VTRELLAGGDRLGDRFVALLGEPSWPGWWPAAEVFGPALPDVLPAVCEARGTENPAVAGLLRFEQYALRTVSPVVAALHLEGVVVDARLSAVRVQIFEGRIRRLPFAGATDPAEPDRARAQRRAGLSLVGQNLEPAADAVRRVARLLSVQATERYAASHPRPS